MEIYIILREVAFSHCWIEKAFFKYSDAKKYKEKNKKDLENTLGEETREIITIMVE